MCLPVPVRNLCKQFGRMKDENAPTKIVSETSFKRCIHEVFDVSLTKTNQNNNVVTVYKGLIYVDSHCDQPQRMDLDLILSINMICDNSTYLTHKLTQIACITDFSLAVKKIHNGLYSSGNSENHRWKIIHPKGYVFLDILVKAYQWDIRVHP